jgi:hypothetical protein
MPSPPKIVKSPYGARFALNPTKAQFEALVGRAHGAAFYIDEAGDAAFGFGDDLSLDHSSICHAFGLGEEAARGYIRCVEEPVAVVEVWIELGEGGVFTDEMRARAQAQWKAATANPGFLRVAPARVEVEVRDPEDGATIPFDCLN